MNLRPILGDMVAYFYNSLVGHLPVRKLCRIYLRGWQCKAVVVLLFFPNLESSVLSFLCVLFSLGVVRAALAEVAIVAYCY